MKHDNSEPQSLFTIRILQVLWKYSNENHWLMDKDIIKKLQSDYDICLERKAIQRARNNLQDMFERDKLPLKIVPFIPKGKKGKRGVYLQRPFENSELRLLIDSVLASRHISENHAKELANKLCLLSNVDFAKTVKYISTLNLLDANFRAENTDLFKNIELIAEAIQESKQITLKYNTFGGSKVIKREKEHKISPYQLIIHNQHYFVIAAFEDNKTNKYEKINLRIDKMTDIHITGDNAILFEDVYKKKYDVPYKKLTTSYPYMFTDDPTNIEFCVTEGMLGEVFDYFGNNISVIKQSDGRYKISVISSKMAMKIWALKYIPDLEIISPATLREEVIEEIKKAVNLYNI